MDEQINGGDDSYRDASFSYLRSEQSLTQKSTSTSFGLDRKKTDQGGEISVFGAERYFNTALDYDHHHDQDHRSLGGKKQGGHDHHDLINKPGTPSACSDVSWASKSTALLLKASSGGLIRNPSRKYHNRKSKIINGSKTFFATLGCTGTCTDEKSIHVDRGDQDKQASNHDHHAAGVRNDEQVVQDQHGSLSQQPNRMNHLHHHHHDHRLRYEAKSTKRSEEHFAFPILSGSAEENNSKTAMKPAEKHAEIGNSTNVVIVDEPPRMSLEVFGSKTTLKGANVLDEVAINLERKLSVLTWDAIPAKPYSSSRVSPKASRPGSGRSGPTHDDVDSDASSDLFEIENITSGMRRASEEALPRCGTHNSSLCGDYEPSEASIEWSVVTASAAADLGSEFYDEKKLAANNKPPMTGQKPAVRKRPSAGLLGCKSQKSVSVAETAHRSSGGGNKEI